MKRSLIAALAFVSFLFSKGQQIDLDSLYHVLNHGKQDSSKYIAARSIAVYYWDRNRDSALHYGEILLDLALRNNKRLNAATAYNVMTMCYRTMGQYKKALEYSLKAFEITRDESSEKGFWSPDHSLTTAYHREGILNTAHSQYAYLMNATENEQQEFAYFKIVGELGQKRNDNTAVYLSNMGIAYIHEKNKKLDSALIHFRRALSAYHEGAWEKYLGNIYNGFGHVYIAMGRYDSAIQYFNRAIEGGIRNDNIASAVTGYAGLTNTYVLLSQKDSSLIYSRRWINGVKELGSMVSGGQNLGNAYEQLSYAYELNQLPDSAHKYLKLSIAVKDSLTRSKIKSLAEFQSLNLDEQLRLQNLEKEKVVYQNRVRTYFMLAGIGVLLLLAIIFYRNNRQKHKAKVRIEQAYDNLKATQQQLIQSEKMASLGELTAGIAHEIQNPLNFVNNFSDVNTELVDEAKLEMEKGNVDEARSILNDIKDNEQRINHHGKRADAIVKGMLQHSRSSSGQKESTDINALADEYIRLAYHGLRAKDKSFNANFRTHFDESIGNINIVPQDIGRVILNLINNAFYAVDEKKKQMPPTPKGEKEDASFLYEPIVTVTTKRLGPPLGDRGKPDSYRVEIRVADNGNGIPQKILDKIFQPFFTTKPTGQGTGLGLSLSYDIVKAHGGELKVNTREGEGSEFIIRLSIS